RDVSWQPDLETALDRVLAFRSGGQPQTAASVRTSHRHPFFEQLERLAAEGSLTAGSPGLPGDVANLLGGNEAFAALLLAAGWDAAALLLHHSTADLSRLPGWFAEGITRAQWANRSSSAALASVLQQPRTPALDLVAGELLAAVGRRADALERLRSATH